MAHFSDALKHVEITVMTICICIMYINVHTHTHIYIFIYTYTPHIWRDRTLEESYFFYPRARFVAVEG